MKILMQRQSQKPKYYLHYNGKLPIFGAKADAVRLTEKMAEKVLGQLSALGFVNITIMDEGDRPE